MFITESRIKFGDFEDDTVYHIEKSELYNKVNGKNGGIKICEFILVKDGALNFVEAKSSAPQSPDDQNKYILDLYEKFLNSCFLYFTICHKRHPGFVAEYPKEILIACCESMNFNFILVIPEFEDQWCSDLHQKLLQDKNFKKLKNLLNIQDRNLKVMNKTMAIRFQLTQSENPTT